MRRVVNGATITLLIVVVTLIVPSQYMQHPKWHNLNCFAITRYDSHAAGESRTELG
jgi:hypothetical protein